MPVHLLRVPACVSTSLKKQKEELARVKSGAQGLRGFRLSDSHLMGFAAGPPGTDPPRGRPADVAPRLLAGAGSRILPCW